MRNVSVALLAVGIAVIVALVSPEMSFAQGEAAERVFPKDEMDGPCYLKASPKHYRTLRMLMSEAGLGPQLGPPPGPVSGTREILVILVELTDAVPDAAHDSAYFYDRFFDTAAPSVRHFYSENSYGQFTWVPGEVHDWFASTYSTTDWDSDARPVVVEAIQGIDPDFDFAPYDADSNGEVTNDELSIFIIVSGSTGGAFHWYTLASVATSDGVNVEGEFCATHEDRHIGSYCHELGHDLGLPDLYDTRPAVTGDSEGIGEYGLMGGGSWTFSHMTAWSKIQLGWITPTIVKASEWYDVRDAETNAEAYILIDPRLSDDEYFLVENRQSSQSYYETVGAPVAPDGTLPDDGIAIYHIDDAQANDWITSGTNNVNGDETRKCVDVETAEHATSHVQDADDLDDETNRGDGDDLWDSGEYDFSDSSTPCNANWYGGGNSRVTVENFPASSTTMSVYFGPYCGPRLTFTINGHEMKLPYYRNVELGGTHPEMTRAVIVIHGNSRNAEDYYDDVEQAATMAGVLGTTHIIVPQFFVESDLDTLPPICDNVLFWNEADGGKAWKRGDESTSSSTYPRPDSISSFAIIDSVIMRLVTNDANLTDIVVAGFSAGGQFVNRYAAGTRMDEELAISHPGIDVRYVVGSPSSYLYMDGQRPLAGTLDQFAVPDPLPAGCPSSYDKYRYGLAYDLNSYMLNTGVDTIRAQYERREVVYLLGDADTTGHATDCMAMQQGDNLLERGIIYFNYLAHYYAGRTYLTQDLSIVPGVGHDAGDMFQSGCGLYALFDFGTCNYKSSVIAPGGPLTIQDAIDFNAQQDYYTLVLKPGTYSGLGNRDITFGGRAMTLRSMDGNPATCIIDCGGLGRGFNFNNSEPPEAVLLGVTIKNGGDVTYGGGINFENSSPTIRDCILLDNSAFSRGGGMNIDIASPTVTSTTMQSNSAPQGGGVYCTGSTPTFMNTIISFSTQGEAFWMDGTSSPAIGHCDFYGNPGGNWGGLLAGYLGINGNIELDPLYCNASIDDLTVCADSPCLPAFNPSGEHLGAQGEGCAECRPPTVTTHPQSQAICVGDPVTFTVVVDGAPTLSYQWRKNSVNIVGATSDSYTIPSVAGADAAGYDVVVTNNSGTDTSNPATLTVNEPVAITAHPQSQTICDGDPVTFTVTATGTGPLSYQWRKNGGNISGATGSSYSIPSVTTGHGGSYDVVVTNVCGALTSNAATLTVDVGPVFSQHPQSVSVCEDDAVVFYVVASGEPPLTYQWRKNSVNLPGATNDSLVIDQVSTDDAGVYDVDVANPCGFALSGAGTLTVDTGPAITAHPQSQLICEGDPVTFTATASGRPPLGYQWRKNSVDILGATNSSYTISSIASGDGGSYDVVVTDDCGSTTSNAATLTVGFVPIVFSVNPSWSLEDPCEGDTISVVVIASAVPGPTYQWRKNGVNLSNGGRVSGATTNALEIKPAGQIDLGSYDVVLSNMCGSDTSYTVDLLTVLPMTVNVPGDYATIQDGIDAVCPYGGVVNLTDTLYQGTGNTDVDYGGAAVTVRSASGDPESCVIDCQNSARGFIFQSGEGSGSVLEGVTVKLGSASLGGAIYCSGAGPTLNNCIFLSNSATSDGGAIYCEFQGVVLTGCIFESNSAGSNGGAVACITSSPAITGCTFRDNSAQTGGGVYAAQNSEPAITNCTFYDNDAWNGSGLGLQMASYANIEKTIISFGRTTNPSPPGCVYCTDSSGPSLWCCDVYGNADGDWIGCIAGSAPPASSNFWADPLFCDTLSIGYDLELQNTSPCLPGASPCMQLVGAHGHGCGGCVVTNSVIFVDGTATGAANGLSWGDAFTDLQDALALANECTTSVDIWVAAGTYYPTDTDDRDARFELVNNTGIYGGFAGTETQRSERDWRANVTVLSGDIGVDEDNSDNSYHITWASGTDSTAIIDGFTITRGHANGAVGFPDGAGMFIGGAGSPTVTNIIFRDNVCTYYGAAMFNYNGSSPCVTNCMFFNNSTIRDGGAIQNRNDCNPVFVNVTFSGNVAERGGAMHNENNSNPTIINAVMWGDSATAGVAEIENVSSSPTISYSLVQGSGGSGAWNSNYGNDGGDNIDDDPLFADQWSGNLRLTTGSPAINAGDSSTTYLPATDLDANPRVAGSRVDMGAYEFQGAIITAYPSPLVLSASLHVATCDTLYLVNSGDSECTIAGISGCESAPFSMDTTMTDHTLAAGDTTRIVVCATPSTQDPDTTTVMIVSNAANNPTTVTVELEVVTGISSQAAPDAFRIVLVSPNPFNPSTTVHFTLPEAMPVTAEIWSVKGARVRLLVSDKKFDPGDNRVVWDGRTDQGTVASSGVYFVRVRTQLGTRVARAVLLK